ncbi:MAG: tRNA-dihydrouridine synthase [Candidatus Moraniibacteriota bacterium]
MENFWTKLPKPFFVTAPLANVTDVVFRTHLLQYSRPDVLWTEFVSADGLSHPKGRAALIRDLEFREEERPIVAQLFTADPGVMRQAARLVAELGFDGVDINMGCPDKNIMKQGAGAACMKDAKLAQALILAAREGTKDAGKELPVSVKTRLGFNEDSLEVWLPALLETKPVAVTLHARTKKEMSKVPAHWERIKRAVEIRDALGSETLIIGNGDVRDMKDARQKVADTGADGIMFGRALLGNPWLFDEKKETVTVEEKLDAALLHTRMYTEHYGDTKSFELLKKHYRAYINHFPLAKELRAEMMEGKAFEEIRETVERFKKEHSKMLTLPSETHYLL